MVHVHAKTVPAFLSLGSRSRCPHPPGAFELSRPLDDQLASRLDWAGIVLHPYVPVVFKLTVSGVSSWFVLAGAVRQLCR